MRDIETIDGELQLLASVRRSIREHGGKPSSHFAGRPRGFIAERLAAFAEAGVTTMLVSPVAADPAESMRYVEEALELRPA
jgi:hypothetical protein